MKRKLQLFGLVALAAAAALVAVSCGEVLEDDPQLTGPIAIRTGGATGTTVTSATVGTELTATYATQAGETGVWLVWTRNGVDIPNQRRVSPNSYTPMENGTYNVRAEATGYQSLTRSTAAVTVTGGTGTVDPDDPDDPDLDPEFVGSWRGTYTTGSTITETLVITLNADGKSGRLILTDNAGSRLTWDFTDFEQPEFATLTGSNYGFTAIPAPAASWQDNIYRLIGPTTAVAAGGGVTASTADFINCINTGKMYLFMNAAGTQLLRTQRFPYASSASTSGTPYSVSSTVFSPIPQ